MSDDKTKYTGQNAGAVAFRDFVSDINRQIAEKTQTQSNQLNEGCGKKHGKEMDEEGCGCGDECDCEDCQSDKEEKKVD